MEIKNLCKDTLNRISANRNISRILKACAPALSVLRERAGSLKREALLRKNLGMVPAVNLVLSGLAVILLLILLISLIRPYSVSLPAGEENSAAMFSAEDTRIIEKIEDMDLDQSMFRSRKLFPQDSASGGEKMPLSYRPPFEIMGIISIQGQRTAVLKDTETGRQYSLLEGEKVKDYIVKIITDDKITLEKEGITMEVYR